MVDGWYVRSWDEEYVDVEVMLKKIKAKIEREELKVR